MKSKIIAIFVLILAVALGAMLPKIVLTYHDKQLKKNTYKYSVEQKDFKTENKVINTLESYGNGLMYEVKDSVTDVSLSEKQVKRNIKKFLITLNKYSLETVDYSNKKVFKYGASLYLSDYKSAMAVNTYASDGENLSSDSKYIIYHCILENKDGYTVDLQMDEETGKVIAFNIYNNENYIKIFKSVEMAKNFITEYYGANVSYNKESGNEDNWYFVLYDEEQKMKATVNVYTSDSGVYFNQ